MQKQKPCDIVSNALSTRKNRLAAKKQRLQDLYFLDHFTHQSHHMMLDIERTRLLV